VPSQSWSARLILPARDVGGRPHLFTIEAATGGRTVRRDARLTGGLLEGPDAAITMPLPGRWFVELRSRRVVSTGSQSTCWWMPTAWSCES
jgi:hypothetical protein